jgi:hypothetical protein
MDTSSPFIFPPDRFPSWLPKADALLAAEEFGPPLSFDPQAPNYRQFDMKIENPGFQFKPTESEIRAKKMEISYNVVTDITSRSEQLNVTSVPAISGWSTTVWRHCNMERKIEQDWDMGYLARKDLEDLPNTMTGLLEYRFNLRESGMCIYMLLHIH